MLRNLLQILSDGNFHSGEELGTQLGVTRAAVWKQLKKLEALNIPLSSVKGKGYRLSDAIQLLDEDVIKNNVSGRLDCLEVLLNTESTNSYLLDKASDHMGKRYAVLSEKQESGRGRRGRTWVSPFGKNIYLSVAFDLQGGVEVLNGLSLVIGLAVIRVLKDLGLTDAELKWPNDIWIDSRKAAGILVELQGEATTGWRVVAGVGLNVCMDERDGIGIDQPWVSIADSISCSRSKLAGMMISTLVDVMGDYQEKGFESFMSEWEESDFLKGKSIQSSGGVSGIDAGINAQGALLVETSEGKSCINAGEVSVRPVCD